MNGNWIKIFTKLLNWEWYKDSNTFRVFIHCLLKANWKEGKFQGISIPRGSFITSRKILSEELNLTEQEIRTAINHLISTNELTKKTTKKYTLISIKNYDKYQVNNQESNFSSTNNQPTANQQLTTIEEYKNINNSVYINAHARTHTREDENFACHLGSTKKEESCFSCMKKNICPFEEGAIFKINHRDETFYEWCEKKEKYNQEIAKSESKELELIDFDWLEEKNDKQKI